MPPPEEALEYVAGYAVSNDVSERSYQVEHSGGQWSKGKCWQQLSLRSAVNGEARQDSNTSDMIFSVAYIVWNRRRPTLP